LCVCGACAHSALLTCSAAFSISFFSSLESLAYPKPGRSVNPSTRFLEFALLTEYRFTAAVAPGVLPTRAAVDEDREFRSDDLPTFERPRNAISGTSRDGMSSVPVWDETIEMSRGVLRGNGVQ